MEILRLMNTNANWKSIIQKAPYCIKVKEDGEYILLKYNMLNSDFSNRIVQECRGSIFRKNENGTWICVCRPFDKFFNYGEQYAADIDWNSAKVTEKIDGSLMKCWYDNGKWHLSTSGTIDAFKAEVQDSDVTFGEVFERALTVPIQYLFAILDERYTYMFELTSSDTRIVVPYEDGIYYLAKRQTDTGLEDFLKPDFKTLNIRYPNVYQLKTLDDIIHAAQQLPRDNEGYVTNDKFGNRIKVKSPAYLAAAHLWMNGHVSEKRILQMLRDNTLDDFLAYFPEYQEFANSVHAKVDTLAENCQKEWRELRKQIAVNTKDNPYRAYLFAKLDHPECNPYDFLMNQLHPDKLEKLMD